MGPLGNDAIGISSPTMGHGKWMEKRKYKAIDFSYEPFLEKAKWVLVMEEKPLFVFPHLSLCQLCNVSFYLPFTRTSVRFCLLLLLPFFFFFFLNQPTCQEKMSQQMKMLIPSGKPFCSSIFVYFCRNYRKFGIARRGYF